MLFDAVLLVNRQQPQTYRSSAATTESAPGPLSQNFTESSYLIDELFDMSDEDHAEIIDGVVKEIQGQADALERTDRQLADKLAKADYDGVYQEVANLQKSLREIDSGFAGAGSLLNYHLVDVAGPTPSPIPPAENLENKQVLGTTTANTDVVQMFTNKINDIEDKEVTEINGIIKSIADDAKSIDDKAKQVLALSSSVSNNITPIQTFCTGRQTFLEKLIEAQKKLIGDINTGKIKQAAVATALTQLGAEIEAEIKKTEDAFSSAKTKDKNQLAAKKGALVTLKTSVENNKSKPPVNYHKYLNSNELYESYQTLITQIQALVDVMCGPQEEAQARKALNDISSDLDKIQSAITSLQAKTEAITKKIESIAGKIPQLNQNDNKDAITGKLATARTLLSEADSVVAEINPIIGSLQGLKNQLESTKKTFKALETQYQTNTKLQTEIAAVANKIERVDQSLITAEAAVSELQREITSLKTSIQILIDQLLSLLNGVSQELKAQAAEEKKEKEKAQGPHPEDVNLYCVRHDMSQNDSDLFKYTNLNCQGKKIGDLCGDRSQSGSNAPPEDRKCWRTAAERVPRKAGPIPLSFRYKFLTLGLSKKEGAVCACKKDNPNQKWVGFKSWVNAYGGNAFLLTNVLYWGQSKLSGDGGGGGDGMPVDRSLSY